MNGDKAIFIWPESSFPVHRGVEAGSHFHPFGMAEDSDLRKTRFHSHFLFDENSHFYLTIFTTDYLKKREREIGREREREKKKEREIWCLFDSVQFLLIVVQEHMQKQRVNLVFLQ